MDGIEHMSGRELLVRALTLQEQMAVDIGELKADQKITNAKVLRTEGAVGLIRWVIGVIGVGGATGIGVALSKAFGG